MVNFLVKLVRQIEEIEDKNIKATAMLGITLLLAVAAALLAGVVFLLLHFSEWCAIPLILAVLWGWIRALV